MPQKELDLLQLASRSVAEPSTSPTQIVRCQLGHTDALGGFFHYVPDRLFRHAISPCPSYFVDPAEQLSSINRGLYGFHRDELQTLDDARNLAWGYVAYPPVTPFIEHAALTLFGPPMGSLRFFSALAQSVAIVVTGLVTTVKRAPSTSTVRLMGCREQLAE